MKKYTLLLLGSAEPQIIEVVAKRMFVSPHNAFMFINTDTEVINNSNRAAEAKNMVAMYPGHFTVIKSIEVLEETVKEE